MADEIKEAEAIVAPVANKVKTTVKAEVVKTDAEMKADAIAAEDEVGKAEGHVKMFLGDVRLWVHKECVAAHKAAGWLINRV